MTAIFTTASKYLAGMIAYLGTVYAFKFAVNKLFPFSDEWMKWVLAAGFAIPLILAIFCSLIPRIIRKYVLDHQVSGKGDPTYFTTSPRTTNEHNLFSNQQFCDFLQWITNVHPPLLHLSGPSGVGKSSLINGYLVPELSALTTPTHVVIVRGYSDPLTAMKDALLSIWVNKPNWFDAATPAITLQRAIEHKRPLIVVFDQFEEFLLLQLTANPNTQLFANVKAFFATFVAKSQAGITILLSYREDYSQLLHPLCLPARMEGTSWRKLPALTATEARVFLSNCPNLTIPDARMSCVLAEAASYEGGQVYIRPIVANLLGLVLRRFSGHPKAWKRGNDLLRGYLRDAIRGESQDNRASLFHAMLSDFDTATPRSVGELSVDTTLSEATVTKILENLAAAGLVRPLNRDEPDPAKRIWQISHDFVATLLRRVLDGIYRTTFRKIRPWLAPVSLLVITIGSIFATPEYNKLAAIRHLSDKKITWNEEQREIIAALDPSRKIESWPQFGWSMRVLQPKHLDLSQLSISDEGIEQIKDLSSLVTLKLAHGNFTKPDTSLDKIKNLNQLTYLRLPLGTNLAKGELGKLSLLQGLENLDLSFCLLSNESLNEVSKLKGLKVLILDSKDVNFEGLRELAQLPNLAKLSLDCQSISGIGVDELMKLKGLIALQLKNNVSNADLTKLQQLKTLASLDLNGTSNMNDKKLDEILRLTNLVSLDLRYTDISSVGIAKLNALLNLQKLYLPDGDFMPHGKYDRKLYLAMKNTVTKLRISLPKCEIVWFDLSP